MKKRFFTLTSTIIIIFLAATPLWAHAAAPAFSISSNIPANRGETVVVQVSVSNNPGFTAVGLMVTFDPNVLQITNVTAPTTAMPLNPFFELSAAAGSQWIHLLNPQPADWSGSGIVANLTFNVLGDAPLGTSFIGLGFTSSPDGTPSNVDGEILSGATALSGSVYITDPFDIGEPDDLYPWWEFDPTLDAGSPDQVAGDFIGAAYTPIATPQAPTAAAPAAARPAPVPFGAVPQTGVANITGLLYVLAVSIITTAALWGGIIYYRYRKQNGS